jgi:hypothetical protein
MGAFGLPFFVGSQGSGANGKVWEVRQIRFSQKISTIESKHLSRLEEVLHITNKTILYVIADVPGWNWSGGWKIHYSDLEN